MKLILNLFFILGLYACGSGISNPFLMPSLDYSERMNTDELRRVHFYVQEIKDERKNKDFLDLIDRKIESHAEAGPVVREAVIESFSKAGAKFSREASNILQIVIKEWQAEQREGALDVIVSTAKFNLIIYNRKGKKVFQGSYSGNASSSSLSHNNDSLARTLSISMKEAIDAMAKDSSLLKLLRK